MGKNDKASSGQELAERKSTAVGQVLDYGDYAGSGLEGVTSDEMVIPFINVLQALSPEVEEVEGAKAGMLFNKGTQELIPGDTGFLFLPVARQLAFVEWKPRKQGGGLIGRHNEDADIVQSAKKACAERGEDPRFTLLWTGKPEESHELRQTYYLYGYVLEQSEAGYDPIGQALLSFNGTKIKVYKNWLTPINMLKNRPPLFAHPTRVGTFKDGNSKGEFYNFKMRPAKGTVVESLLNPANESDAALLKRAHKFASDVKGEKYKMGDETAGNSEEERVPF
jgi:hypothetical protein